jgi:hypothetical protein
MNTLIAPQTNHAYNLAIPEFALPILLFRVGRNTLTGSPVIQGELSGFQFNN